MDQKEAKPPNTTIEVERGRMYMVFILFHCLEYCICRCNKKSEIIIYTTYRIENSVIPHLLFNSKNTLKLLWTSYENENSPAWTIIPLKYIELVKQNHPIPQSRSNTAQYIWFFILICYLQYWLFHVIKYQKS